VSGYTVYVTAQALQEIKDLPGNIRQRVTRTIDELTNHPDIPKRTKLEVAEIECELHRIRIDNWRILYAVNETEKIADVLAVRKRPPYDYGDLERLLKDYTGR
jgi:mRNA interferase RelE/StbE